MGNPRYKGCSRLEAGEFVAVAGPSGSGKSTLLGLAGMMNPATAARASRPPDRHRPGERARIQTRHNGILFQNAPCSTTSR
jgi:ABC-type lipoprotein export system ATPase subunit